MVTYTKFEKHKFDRFEIVYIINSGAFQDFKRVSGVVHGAPSAIQGRTRGVQRCTRGFMGVPWLSGDVPGLYGILGDFRSAPRDFKVSSVAMNTGGE